MYTYKPPATIGTRITNCKLLASRQFAAMETDSSKV